MDRYGRNNDYRGNAHLSPSIFISPRKAHYRNDDPSSPTEQSLQSNTTLPTTNSSSYLYKQYPLLTNVSKAGKKHERLLHNIQHNTNEIDQQISSLEPRSTTSRYAPSPLSSVPVLKKPYIEKIPPLSTDDIQIESNKPRKIYEVVPPIESQPRKISLVLPTNPIEQTNSQLFSGQYHYPPEIEETEINENDPENMDVKSIVGELPELSPPKLLSMERFHREQSPLPYHRVLIFVPTYVDNMERELTETTVDFPQSNQVDTSMARLSFVPSSQNSELSNKLNIKDFTALIRTAPKIKPPPIPKPKIAPPPVPKPKILSPPVPKAKIVLPPVPKPKPASKPRVVPKPVEVPNKIKPNLTSTMIDKPVKHARVSKEAEKKPSPPQDARKKHSITSTPKLPAKKSVPISTHGKMKTKFPWDNTNSNENRIDMFNFGFNIRTFALSPGNGTNNASPSQNQS